MYKAQKQQQGKGKADQGVIPDSATARNTAEADDGAAAAGSEASGMEQQQEDASPFGAVSTTLGFDTFHFVQTTLLAEVRGPLSTASAVALLL